MNRPSKIQTFYNMAKCLSKQSTCSRRQVGCILVNDRHHIIGSGYNGVAFGRPHCTSTVCKGARYPSGEGLEFCEAIHAEQNALMQCKDIFDINTAYVTTPPCLHCTKMLLNTSTQIIVCGGEYAHERESKALWIEAGRSWCNLF